MSFFARMFEHSPSSATVAKDRLKNVLTHERMRISPQTHSVSITFRGTREGLCITLGNGPWADLMDELVVQLEQRNAESYFRGARVFLEAGDRAIGKAQLDELVGLLTRHEMSLSSVIGQVTDRKTPPTRPVAIAKPETTAPLKRAMPGPPEELKQRPKPALAASKPFAIPQPPRPGRPAGVPGPRFPGTAVALAQAGLPPERLAALKSSRNGEKVDNPLEASQALLIRRTVRSGQVVHYAGTIVIFGDVNPAAEVIAEGDVIILGKLRGVVHAGSTGNESAVVGALILAPTQVRIGGQVARAPDERRWHPWPAEIARVRGGQIIVEPWGVA